MTDFAVDEIPPEVRETTERLLAGDERGKADLLACAEWWCRNESEDNVVTELAVAQLYVMQEPPTPHEHEQLEDKRDETIYHLRTYAPELVPDDI
jgi:hypothetical protein